MKVPDANENALITSFSSTKRQILIILKQQGEIDLTSLSKKLGITKMAVLNHIKDLESLEIIERFHMRRDGPGRPRLAIRLSPTSEDIFPKAYASITTSILEFIEENMGRNAVFDALRKRTDESHDQYNEVLDQLENQSFENRVEEFSKLRNQDGYMVELRMIPDSPSYEFVEYNCPILGVADTYNEACMVERELFEELLNADVDTTHRTVAGDNVCRFLIKPKS